MKKTLWILLGLLGCLACPSFAEEQGKTWLQKLMSGIYTDDTPVKLIPGLRLTHPQGVAVSAAAFVNVGKLMNGKSYPHGFKGPFLQIEPGYGGLKTGVGIGSVDSFGFIGGLKLSHYRTWTDFASLDSGEEYAGLDVTLSGFLSSFSLGVYTGVNSKASDFLVSAGWGYGF